MNQSADDSHVRHLIERLKRADEPHVPGFDDVLNRSAREAHPRQNRRLRITVVSCAVMTLLVSVMIVRSYFHVPIGADLVVQNNVTDPSAAASHTAMEINFDDIHAVVDDYVRSTELESVEVPQWATRTDYLLSLNLEIPLTED